MSPNGTGEAAPADDSDDRGLSLTRRKFLKRGAAAGIGAAALYIAPSMSSATARRAYAGITAPPAPCTDTEPPVITSISTCNIVLLPPETLQIDTAVGGYITATAEDNEALAEIEIKLVGAPQGIGDAYFTCAEKVKSGSYTQYFDPLELGVGFYDGTATATDCCGLTGSKSFVLQVTNLGSV